MSTLEALDHDAIDKLDESVLSSAVDEFLENNDAIFKTVSIVLHFQEQNGKRVSSHTQASFPVKQLHPTLDLLTDEEFFRSLQVHVLSSKRQLEDTQKWNPTEQNKEFLEEANKAYAILQNPFESEIVQHFIAEQRSVGKGMKEERELIKVARCYSMAIKGHAEEDIREIQATVTYIDRATPSINRTWDFTHSR